MAALLGCRSLSQSSSGLATRGDHGTAGEQPPQPHLYGSDLGGIAPSDYPMFEFQLSTQSRSPIAVYSNPVGAPYILLRGPFNRIARLFSTICGRAADREQPEALDFIKRSTIKKRAQILLFKGLSCQEIWRGRAQTARGTRVRLGKKYREG